MSRIQAAYDVLAREPRESEKPAVEAFEAKYAHAMNPHGPDMPFVGVNERVAEYHVVFTLESNAAGGYDLVNRSPMAASRAWTQRTGYVSLGTAKAGVVGTSPFDCSFANDSFLEGEFRWKNR